ncbi:MAG TPA: hypothetical protein VGO80_03135 [Solirubrobacteraceae bacterium]|nr:hypothetical protein [Solirubrobacteraceae bacterium]
MSRTTAGSIKVASARPSSSAIRRAGGLRGSQGLQKLRTPKRAHLCGELLDVDRGERVSGRRRTANQRQ